MIVVKLQGGLGNQLFQYAVGKALAHQHQSSFALDVEFLLDRKTDKGTNFVFRDYDLDLFHTDAYIVKKGTEERYRKNSFLNKVFSGFRNKTLYKEKEFGFDPSLFSVSEDLYLDGYWQSPKYFQDIEQELRKDFSFIHPIEEHSQALYKKIQTTQSVCINVRRADFVNNSFHGVCDMKYYDPAIAYMSSRLSDPHLYIFSDDPEWCKANFRTSLPMEILGHEHKGYKFGNYLQMMVACKHFIIPNSTFAWWAVWLSNNKESIVIAPEKWFGDERINTEDLIPKSWLRFAN